MNKWIALGVVGLLAAGLYASWRFGTRRSLAAVPRRAAFLHPCSPGTYAPGALCGTYEVWEDRAVKAGRRIRLNIVVLPAMSAKPASDPVFWLVGGPGGAATDSARDESGTLADAVGDTRDLVFVDQRGTGRSNGLQCSFNDDPADLSSFFGALFRLDTVRACRDKLEKSANLRLYTTPIAMDDLDEVREALGYDTINIAGESYGSFAAQIYMRQHPNHLRAVFLAGAAPPSIRLPLLFPRAAQLALDEAFRDCAADADCHKNFPEVVNEFAAVMARFDQGPVLMELVDPATKKRVQISVLRESFVEHLRLALYTTGMARYVPYVIHRAYQGDYVPFEAIAIAANAGGGLARGMYMTVTCSEGVPFIGETDIVREAGGTFVGEKRIRSHLEACKEWPRGDIPADYTELVKSDLPVLIISGEADGATAPWYGEAAVRNFPNGRQVKIPHYGHQDDGPCVARMFREFIQNRSVHGIDASCAARTHRPPFATKLPNQFALE